MKRILSILGLFGLSAAAVAQTARVQVIHNCADAAASTVDVYLNDAPLIPDFAFRTASPFVDAPAGIPLTIAIAPGNSMSAMEAVAVFENIVLTEGETYVVVANGIVSGTGYSPAPAFNLDIFAGAREAAADGNNVDVLAIHGSTDAPTVDVVETAVLGGTAIDDLSYPEFAGYLELPADDYRLAITTADQSVTVASYEAPLATLGLQGAAVTVVASGFLDPSSNSNGPAFGLWAALASGGPLVQLPTSTARVQVIHNSADAAAEVVDVYLNGSILIDDFAFRTASPFVDAPAGVPVSIAIAGPNSTSAAEAVATFDLPGLEPNETYVVVANGIVSGSGYTPSPAFGLDIFAGARESAAVSGNVDVLVVHGSTDAPTVDVAEANLGITLVDDASYGDFAGYLELGLADYVINVTNSTGDISLFSYRAPLAALGLQDQALTVVASGFVSPDANSGGPSFGLWVATAEGGPLLALPSSTARLQIIHNSPDPLASVVDIYAGGLFTDVLEVQDLGFRQATPFVDVPANVEITVAIAGADSESAEDAIVSFNYTLEDGGSYIVTASGLVVPDGYTPATPFSLEVFSGARESASNSAETDVLVLHGSTDAPAVDVEEALLGLSLVTDLSYPEYAGYLSLATSDYVLGVAPAGGDNIALFGAPLQTLGLTGAAITVVASGFLDPSVNQDGAAFGLFAALASGGDLVPLPAWMVQDAARVQVIHNSADEAAEVVDVYVTSAFSAPVFVDDFAFRTATPFVDVISGTPVVVAVCPPNSDGPEDAIASFELTLGAGESYVVVANGIVSEFGYSPAPAFGLDIFAGARESAGQASNTDVLVYHGSTDAPTVDVEESSIPAGTLVDNIAYGEFQGYLELGTADYIVDVTDETGNTVVASYLAPLSTLGLDGAALCVLASGFLDPSNNSNGPAFGLWVALPAGGDLVELPVYVGVEETELVSGMVVYPNPSNGEVVTLTGELLQAGQFEIIVEDMLGRRWAQDKLTFGNGTFRYDLEAAQLPAGTYVARITNGNTADAVRFSVVK